MRGNYSDAEKLKRNATIREMKAAGYTVKRIAKIFDMSNTRIRQILNAAA